MKRLRLAWLADWGRERRDTAVLMGAALLSVLPHLPHLPWWCVAGFALLFGWRTGLLVVGRWLPRRSVRLLAAAAAMLAVWAQYRTLFGREPGIVLLVLFLGLKLIEMEARRDLLVVLFLCLFLLVTGFLHAQDLMAAAWSLAGLFALVTALVTLQPAETELRLRARVLLSARLLLQALPFAVVVFLLFPRTGGPLWSMDGQAATAGTGLSETMSPGAIGELTLSDEIAFRAEFDGPVPPARSLFWRGPVMGLYDGRTWRMGHDGPVDPPAPEVRPSGRPAIDYRLLLAPSGRDWVFTLEHAVATPRADDRRPVSVSGEHLVTAPRGPAEALRLHARADLQARIGLAETPLTLSGWLQLPPGQNRRTLELAATWRAAEPRGQAASRTEADPETELRLVRRALDLFGQAPFRYTLSPPPVGRDGVDDFLFRTRAGFCEHYAGAFVVLMRALDIPARVVTGYQGGEIHPVDGSWTVRQADAHAWAEVWVAGRGWLRVDPTAAVAPERVERARRPAGLFQGLQQEGLVRGLLDWRLGLEAAEHAWRRWVLDYDRERQRQLLASLGLPVTDWLELVGLAALALALPVAAFALLTLHAHGPRDPLARFWKRFCARLAACGIERAPQDTPLALLARIEAQDAIDPAQRALARRIVERYNALRYDADTPPAPAAMRELRQLLHAFQP